MNVLTEIMVQAQRTPDAAAVVQLAEAPAITESVALTYQQLVTQAQNLAWKIEGETLPSSSVGIVMGNSPQWVLADLALMISKRVEVPVPLAFSADQAAHLLQGCALVLIDEMGARKLQEWRTNGLELSATVRSVALETQAAAHPMPDPVACESGADSVIKVIHTSGTTSKPKGVKIRRDGLSALVQALWQRARRDDYQRYLVLVPLSLLIEQVTALYMPLTSGGAVVLPPASLPPLGSPGVIADERLALICSARPTAMTLTPALVEAIAHRAETLGLSEHQRIEQLFGTPRLPLLAAGGAPVEREVLFRLQQLGIDIFQGYGLSENSSVATWNFRGANRLGSVGQALPHVELRLAEDGELCLRSSSLFAGYSNEDPSSCVIDAEGWLHTGDLASIDPDGFVSIIGRKKTMIITANGRNVSPEWLESAYRQVPGVEQVIVFGDRQVFLGGLFIINAHARPAEVRAAIARFAREHLNEIEQIPHPVLIAHSEEVMGRLFTVTGRPRRTELSAFLKDSTVRICA
ncbi:AMP-binding protein [Pseudomonas brassicacearum]|uniref:AMP-dependent synthetase n=1 Tax=Pseudomonas brassicacearum TaxID=930166 RepID=A0A423GRN0_9PSED|nr:AMP-binding protein [Pseudomonas brassicacearum]ROM97173.1 AMP-dependent synthetase [Pseudomonas brassicacearum]